MLEPHVLEALDGIEPGDRVIVLTWLHLARRDVLRSTPATTRRTRCEACSARARPTGRTRSGCTRWRCSRSRRPGPVSPLEAVDGTPILDLKPVI